ncbi:MAG: hypothetical protein ANABAC_3331 [Anaerolineae bacterium]|jgi:hypothetical protein|nr:MAG: hypothetical protein ANABAC_3331 [Anaerolineae bacterium]
MMIDYAEFRDWIDTLYRHPEWRQELRRLVLTDEILELPQLVRELAEAQKRTDERVGRLEIALAELAEAQKRTDERVGRLEIALAELAEAQKRTEQRVEELAEAQKRTEERVGRLEIAVADLAEAQKRLGIAVGNMQRVMGSTVEEEAAGVVEVILRRKGYRILQPSYSLPLNGEIDVVLPLEDPQGQKVWAVVEAKARLSKQDVRVWSNRIRSEGWRRRMAKKGCEGPYLVYMYSIRADLSALEAAEKEGIGLLKSDGEVLAPKGLVESIVK